MKIKAWYVKDTGDTGAVLLKNKATAHDATVWIPRSQILYMKKFGKDANGNQEVHATLSNWFAKQKVELKHFTQL